MLSFHHLTNKRTTTLFFVLNMLTKIKISKDNVPSEIIRFFMKLSIKKIKNKKIKS